MVITVAACPLSKKFFVYDDICDKYEEKVCSITVREWENEKIDEYFQTIISVFNKEIDEFYLFLTNDYLNEICKNFVKLSKKHGFKEFHIMSEEEVFATIALKYLHSESDSLWVFHYTFGAFMCDIWEKNNDQKFKHSEHLFQRLTTSDPNLYSAGLQSLKNKICSASVSPTIFLIQSVDKIPENIFKGVFDGYSEIYFHKFISFSVSWLCDLLYIIQRQKNNKILYEILPTLGRSMIIKYDQTFIKTIQNCVLPFETTYTFFVKEKNKSLKIYEQSRLTQTINIHEIGPTILNLKIDTDKIFTITLERKGINWNFLSPLIPEAKKEIFKIPSKLLEYNKNLNAVGIDFGTSECCTFVIRRNGPEGVVLDPVTNLRNLPSYVAVEDLNQPCGQNIVNRMEKNPEFLAFDVKSLIGKEFGEVVVDPLWSYDILNYCEQISLLFNNKYNFPRLLSSAAVSSYLFKQIKEKAEEFQGAFLDGAVITVPSSFSQKQKDAIIDAAFQAAWHPCHLLPEPIAALFAYFYETEIPSKPFPTFALLFDCGGGTTDICISKIVDNNIEIVNDNGDPMLGGKNFDKLLINFFNDAFIDRYGLNVLQTNKKYRLMIKCQEIKYSLSVNLDDNLFVDDFIVDNDDVIPIKRKEFEDMATDLILRAQTLIDESLRKANLSRNNINIVFQCGGGCRMPMIKQMLKQMFPKAHHQCSIHPEELVAKGAALHAYDINMRKSKKGLKNINFGLSLWLFLLMIDPTGSYLKQAGTKDGLISKTFLFYIFCGLTKVVRWYTES